MAAEMLHADNLALMFKLKCFVVVPMILSAFDSLATRGAIEATSCFN